MTVDQKDDVRWWTIREKVVIWLGVALFIVLLPVLIAFMWPVIVGPYRPYKLF